MIRRSFLSSTVVTIGISFVRSVSLFQVQDNVVLHSYEQDDIAELHTQLFSSLQSFDNAQELARRASSPKEIILRKTTADGYLLKFRNYEDQYVSVKKGKKCQFFFHQDPYFDLESYKMV